MSDKEFIIITLTKKMLELKEKEDKTGKVEYITKVDAYKDLIKFFKKTI